ncbi:hypothetical protein [Pannonibacter phragmitetus]|uniref:hypothetical protein n=1 Tax=Pannonibacter phragmitetus TaxID=121719 RepID=UPI00128F621E|nr:hypothetical protein [Pannonibacter phragmitetus]
MLNIFRKYQKWVIGAVFGVVLVFLMILLHSVFDLRARCSSGWISPSIGSSGACSHHGGVDRTRPRLAWVFSLVISGLAAWWTFKKLEKVQEYLPTSDDSVRSKEKKDVI